MRTTRRSFSGSLLATLTVVSTRAIPAPPASVPDLDTIGSEIAKRSAADEFSGAVLVARGDEPLFQRAYGEANRERKVANDLLTRFRFGSMGKMFTATAIMQCVQQGKLRLQDPVSKIISDYPNKEVSQVTIEQLLTHTGGTGDVFGPEFMSHRESLKTLSDYVQLYGSRSVKFPPGTQHEYSNYGYILLGRIIEVVSDQTYEEYVRDHVFKRAGMNSTDNQPESSHIDRLAVGYTRAPAMRRDRGSGPDAGPRQGPPESNESLHRADDLLPYRGTSAGGGYSTIGDLHRFARALSGNQLLDAKHTSVMTTGKVDTPMRGLRYAFGFEDATTPRGVRRIGHGGGAPGMNGVLWIYPHSDHVIAVLANRDPPAAQDIARFIEANLPLQ